MPKKKFPNLPIEVPGISLLQKQMMLLKKKNHKDAKMLWSGMDA
jgi:hypothetical protein